MLSDLAERLQRFVDYAQRLKGDEKGEAQVFCDRLFQAFGHEGYKEAGATLEDRQHRLGKNVKFIDLLWKPRLILEMKSRTENLRDHYQQAFEYWLHSVPHRPRYVVLCNFDEFWPVAHSKFRALCEILSGDSEAEIKSEQTTLEHEIAARRLRLSPPLFFITFFSYRHHRHAPQSVP